MNQPKLVGASGLPFYGRAEKTGDLWWYEQDGKRFPLRPEDPQLERLAPRTGAES